MPAGAGQAAGRSATGVLHGLHESVFAARFETEPGAAVVDPPCEPALAGAAGGEETGERVHGRIAQEPRTRAKVAGDCRRPDLVGSDLGAIVALEMHLGATHGVGLEGGHARGVLRFHEKALALGFLRLVEGGCDGEEQQSLGIARQAVPRETRVGGKPANEAWEGGDGSSGHGGILRQIAAASQRARTGGRRIWPLPANPRESA